MKDDMEKLADFLSDLIYKYADSIEIKELTLDSKDIIDLSIFTTNNKSRNDISIETPQKQ